MTNSDQTCVVTGGRGFLGRRLVLKLLEADWEVRIADILPEIVLDDSEAGSLVDISLKNGRAKYFSANICSYDQIDEVIKGASVVFHMAAPNPLNNDYKIQYAVSVTGTENVIKSCLEQGVKKLIYTSSASVVFDGITHLKNIDESAPYPEKAMDSYGETKAAAEKKVLEANGRNGLLTASLRPSGIFGPGDPLLVPKLVKNAINGKLKYVIGSGENMMDFTYVDNVAHAHICAEKNLGVSPEDKEDNPSGKAYFITNGEPRKFWDFIFLLATGLGYGKPVLHLPAVLIIFLAHVYQFVAKYLERLGVKRSSEFSPSVIRISTRWRTFSCARAAKLIGYAPPVPLEEGVRRTVESFSHLRKEVMLPAKPVRELEKSKSFSTLGGGKTAELLLWKNKAATLVHFSVLLLLYYFLFASGRSLVYTLAMAALILTFALPGYNRYIRFYSQKLLSYELPELKALELSETAVKSAVVHVSVLLNDYALPSVRRVANEVIFPLQVIVSLLLFIYLFGSLHFGTFLILVLLLAFTVPKLYEQYEVDVDSHALKLYDHTVHISGRATDFVSSKLPKMFQRKQD